jgi:hypothetical protein
MRRGRCGGGDGFGRFRRTCGFAGDGDAGAEELALVLLILACDPFGDGLGALEVGGGVEKSTLCAAVQFGGALGAGLGKVVGGGQGAGAAETTAGGDVLDHARQARRGDIHGVARGRKAFARWFVPWSVPWSVPWFISMPGATVLVAMLAIFAISVHMRRLLR